MSTTNGQAREEQFLGALLGTAIGDALGHSLSNLSATDVTERLAGPLGYGPASEERGPEGAGAITHRTEIVLCLVESLTTNDGRPDPDNMAARMGFLAAGPSRELMSPGTIEGIELAIDRDGQVPTTYQPPAELSVASRGIPIGLLHAVGGFDRDLMRRESVVVTHLSHAGSQQEDLTEAVAGLIAATARSRAIPAGMSVPDGEPGQALAAAVAAMSSADSFEEGLRAAVAPAGDRASIGAIAGALLGARFGASGIPQALIDDLDARIYLSLAAPWFYRTSMMRAGTVIDLRQIS